MPRILITGSNDGLGRDAARRLVDEGHSVVGHARNTEKADRLRRDIPEIADVLVADLSNAAHVSDLAAAANSIGTFDAIIQNAGVGGHEATRQQTPEGHAHTLAVNVLAPYLLTAWMHRPDRIVYLTSGLQQGASTDLSDLDWNHRRWDGFQAYCESKLYDATLAAAVARRWPDVCATSASPGWVATKMGGAGAPDDLDEGSRTQAWLAVSEDPEAGRSGAMYYHGEAVLEAGPGARSLHPSVNKHAFQDALLDALAGLTGVPLPDAADHTAVSQRPASSTAPDVSATRGSRG